MNSRLYLSASRPKHVKFTACTRMSPGGTPTVQWPPCVPGRHATDNPECHAWLKLVCACASFTPKSREELHSFPLVLIHHRWWPVQPKRWIRPCDSTTHCVDCKRKSQHLLDSGGMRSFSKYSSHIWQGPIIATMLWSMLIGMQVWRTWRFVRNFAHPFALWRMLLSGYLLRVYPQLLLCVTDLGLLTS